MKEVSPEAFWGKVGPLDVIPWEYRKTETHYVTEWEMRDRRVVGRTTKTICYPQISKYYLVE